ncbi:MAG: hypothetical protein UDR60_10060 [Catenibacterium mitsuokai]|nr:hypothetical protein [Catenibacterium mitsuokai]MEE0335241.1 hypothetical protein [Catenibacterium mitsuokai]
MLNAEKYRAEILGKDCKFGLSNRICKCCYEECATCVFSLENNPNDGLSNACTIRKVKWLLSEYKETAKLSKLEYEFLKWSEKKGHKYIVRDKINHLFIFKDAPIKRENCWVPESSYCSIALFDNLFKFIKQEDEEPIAIKDILENCEVVNDAEE